MGEESSLGQSQRNLTAVRQVRQTLDGMHSQRKCRLPKESFPKQYSCSSALRAGSVLSTSGATPGHLKKAWERARSLQVDRWKFDDTFSGKGPGSCSSLRASAARAESTASASACQRLYRQREANQGSGQLQICSICHKGLQTSRRHHTYLVSPGPAIWATPWLPGLNAAWPRPSTRRRRYPAQLQTAQ